MRRSNINGGGCCTTKYTTTPYVPYYTNDVSEMGRIMLRFRPIAPKPATTGPNSSSSSSTGSTSPKKRKTQNNKSTTTSRKKSHVVTLSLLPETPDLNGNGNGNDNDSDKSKEPKWIRFGPSDEELTALEVIQSTITVEQVLATWQDGSNDEEIIKRRLEEDTCPGFISDGWNRVLWTNEEYRKMVIGNNNNKKGKEDTWRKERLVSVKMEMREKVEKINGGGFTCRVRVQYGKINGGGFTEPLCQNGSVNRTQQNARFSVFLFGLL